MNIDYIKVLFAIAWADNELQEEESALLSEVILSFELTESDFKQIEEWKKNPVKLVDLKNIDFNSFPIEQKKHILLLTLSVAKADCVVTKEEVYFVSEFKKMLGLEDVSEAELISDVHESMDIFGGS